MTTTPDIRMSDMAPLHVVELKVPRHPLQQSADGTPHVTYFEDQTSFCWSGDPNEPIEVSYGASGEPATALIEFPVEPARATLAEHLMVFRAVCDEYLAQVSQ